MIELKPNMRWIPGCEQRYAACTKGRVWSFVGHAPRTIGTLNPNTYIFVNLVTNDGEHVNGNAQRRVYEAFYGPIPEGLVVAHLNGDPVDNRPENLVAVTQVENMAHAREHGTLTRLMTDEEVVRFRRARKEGASYASMAREAGYSLPSVREACLGITFAYLDEDEAPVASATKANKGSANGRSVLTEEDVREMRRLRAEAGWTYPELAQRFNVSKSNVVSVCSRRTWKHVP